jgi:hypothetical protein
MKDVKADATFYILTMLLQRFEVQNPGTLNEMLEGVKADQAALAGTAPESEHLTRVFQETLSFLMKAKDLSIDAHSS